MEGRGIRQAGRQLGLDWIGGESGRQAVGFEWGGGEGRGNQAGRSVGFDWIGGEGRGNQAGRFEWGSGFG